MAFFFFFASFVEGDSGASLARTAGGACAPAEPGRWQRWSLVDEGEGCDWRAHRHRSLPGMLPLTLCPYPPALSSMIREVERGGSPTWHGEGGRGRGRVL